MYDIDLIKNLLIKTSVNGQYSVCDTCIHQDNDKSCRYMKKGKCSNNLEEYVPNENMINFKI
jgi:hypothetical protein